MKPARPIDPSIGALLPLRRCARAATGWFFHVSLWDTRNEWEFSRLPMSLLDTTGSSLGRKISTGPVAAPWTLARITSLRAPTPLPQPTRLQLSISVSHPWKLRQQKAACYSRFPGSFEPNYSGTIAAAHTVFTGTMVLNGNLDFSGVKNAFVMQYKPTTLG